MNNIEDSWKVKSLKKRIKNRFPERWNILEKVNWKCQKCGKRYKGPASLNIDKIRNLVLCRECLFIKTPYKIPGKVVRDNNEVIEKVMEYGNMSKVAIEYHVSRERIRQIVTKHLRKEIREGLFSGRLDSEGLSIKELIRKEIRGFAKNNTRKTVFLKLKRANEKGIFPDRYTSTHQFARDTNITHRYLIQFSPDTLDIIRKNITRGQGGTRWSKYYLKCRTCGLTAVRHQSHGYCYKCYPKTDIFKSIQEASRIRNQHKWKEKQNLYLEKYNDLKDFGGNRYKASKRDGFKCVNCLITAKEHLIKYKEKIRVAHLGNPKDHSLNNLVTLCRHCWFKHKHAKMTKAYRNQ